MSEEQASYGEGAAPGWVLWREARQRVEKAGLCSRGQLPGILYDWVEAGLVEARVQTLMIDGKQSPDPSIPAELWAVTRMGDKGWIDWQTGQIVGSVSRPVPQAATRYKGFGLMFRQDQLESLTPLPRDSGGPPAANDEPANKGGRKRADWWPEFVAELVFHVHNEGVPDGQGTEGSEALITAILGKLQERGVTCGERSTVQPAVTAALRRLRSDK